jgi:hypothetical protein
LIIFDEYEHCEYLLKNKIKNIYQRDLNYLSKYWKEKELTSKQIEHKLIEWCKIQDPQFKEDVESNRKSIKKALVHGGKYGLRHPVTITMTEKEIEAIKRLEDYRHQKIAFIMLLVACYFKYNKTKKSPETAALKWGVYCNAYFKDVVALAGISLTKQEQDDAKHALRNAELISATRKGPNSFRINFYEDQSNVVLAITDYRNPIAYFQRYCGENVIECECCGMLMLKSRGVHRMCKKCGKNKRLELVKNNVKNYRKRAM